MYGLKRKKNSIDNNNSFEKKISFNKFISMLVGLVHNNADTELREYIQKEFFFVYILFFLLS